MAGWVRCSVRFMIFAYAYTGAVIFPLIYSLLMTMMLLYVGVGIR